MSLVLAFFEKNKALNTIMFHSNREVRKHTNLAYSYQGQAIL